MPLGIAITCPPSTQPAEPTRTAKTESRYITLFAKLCSRLPKFGFALDMNDSYVEPEVWAAFLLWHKKNRAKSTFRQYQAAIYFCMNRLEKRNKDAQALKTQVENPNEQTKIHLHAIEEHLRPGQKTNNPPTRGRPKKSTKLATPEFYPGVSLHSALAEKILIQNTPQQLLNGGKPVGPAAKVKEVTSSQHQQMLNYIYQKNRKPRTKKELCFLIVLCSQAFGLRPSEWANAKFTVQGLLVINGKNTNGRANGDTRLIPMDAIQMHAFLSEAFPNHTSKDLLSVAKTYDQEIEFAIPLVSMLLIEIERLCDEKNSSKVAMTAEERKEILNNRLKFHSRVFDCLDERLSLYSGRHQFAANVKNFLNADAVAQLMGHESIQTADRNYARKTSGRAGFRELSSELGLRKKFSISTQKPNAGNSGSEQSREWRAPTP